MAHGPGKYDPLATYVRESAHAEAVAVIVINGSRGTGFSVQGTANVQEFLPDLLDHMAAEIRRDLRHVSASGFTPPQGKSAGTPIKHGESVQVYEAPPDVYRSALREPWPTTFMPEPAPVPEFRSGGGGDYAGAGASGSWDAAPAVPAAVHEASSQPSPPEPSPPPPPEPPPPPPPPSDP